jgi:predicted acylesterase/phospholipase RssA
VIHALTDDWYIEDLWIPFFALATNLSSAREVVYQRGLVRDALRRSVAIPGVFTPLVDDGDVIVDGGIMNNFPVDVMARLGESERILGISVVPPQDKKRDYDIGTGVSGWEILWNRINPLSKKKYLPRIAGVLLRATEVHSVKQAKINETIGDLILYPEPVHYGKFDFEAYREIAQFGYEKTIDPLRAWFQRQPDIQ